MRPEQMYSIRPNSEVTLQATFNAPKGLTAQEFINSWGQCAFLLAYNGLGRSDATGVGLGKRRRD
jgi:hypothetical protein